MVAQLLGRVIHLLGDLLLHGEERLDQDRVTENGGDLQDAPLGQVQLAQHLLLDEHPDVLAQRALRGIYQLQEQRVPLGCQEDVIEPPLRQVAVAQ